MSTPEFSSEMVWEWYNTSLVFLMQKIEVFVQQVLALDLEMLSRILLFNHAVWVAMSVISKLRDIDKQQSGGEQRKSILASLPFFAGFLLMCVSGMGGSLTTALLTGDKAIFIGKDEYLVMFFLVWIVMAHAPKQIFNSIANFLPIKFVIVFIEGIFLSRVVCNAVDTAVTAFPKSHLTPILLGTFSGFGGSILGGFFLRQLGSMAKHELAAPTWGSKMALFTSSFYYLSRYVIGTPPLPVEIAGQKYQFSLRTVVAAAYIFVMVLNVVIFPGGSKAEAKHAVKQQKQQQPTAKAQQNDHSPVQHIKQKPAAEKPNTPQKQGNKHQKKH